MSEPAPSAPSSLRSPGAGVLAALARRPFAALLLLCILAWLPGFATLPALDRDEARFAQASKQMVETGNWVDIRFGDQARYKKPIGIYWLQAASTKLLGTPPFNAIWTYRLPSLLGAIVAAFLAFWCLAAMAPPATALTGAGLLALTLGLTAEAHIAKTDAVLLATMLAAEGVLLRVYLAARDAARARPGIWAGDGRLGGVRRWHPDQGPAHRRRCRADGLGGVASGIAIGTGSQSCDRCPGSRWCWCWFCPGSSPSVLPAMARSSRRRWGMISPASLSAGRRAMARRRAIT